MLRTKRLLATVLLATTSLTACAAIKAKTADGRASSKPPAAVVAKAPAPTTTPKPAAAKPAERKFTPAEVFAILYYTNKPFRQAFQKMFVIPYNYDMWWRVALCEEGGRLHSHGRFGNGLESAGTGLGFSVDAWRMAQTAARERRIDLPWGGAADWHEQMTGAQAFKDKYGGGPDCL